MTNKLFFCAILALCSLSCKDDLEFQKSVQDKNTVQKTGKELTFKGFKVNHRYKTPDVYIDDDKKGKEPLMSVYGGDVSLADFSMKDIAEATEKVFKNYPFPSKAKNYKTDFAMIKKDFPGLDEKDIIKNEKLIEQYYDINLDYEVLQLLKKTKTPITKKAKIKTSRYSSKNTKPLMSVFRTAVDCKNCKVKMPGYEKSYDSFEKCIGLKLMSQGYWITSHKADKVFWSRATYSLVESKEEAYKYFEKGKDDKTDAKRHIYWSALLARNYNAISSKLSRLKFAEDAGDAIEECGSNYTDASQMDYRNNQIGRGLFDDNTTYKTILGMTYGLNLPSQTSLFSKTINLVDNSSVWIKAAVKYYNDEESDEVREKNIVSDRKYKITQAADKSKPVYLHDPELVDINYLCGNDTKTIYLKGAYAKGWEVDTKHLQKVAATKSSITVKSITNKSDLRSSITATLYGVNAKNNNTKKNFYFTINPTNYLSIQKTVSRTPYSTILDVSVSGGNPPYEFYFNGSLVKTSNSPNESIYISSSWAPLQVKAKDDCGKTISVYEMVGIGGMSGGI